jgi:hypothetical protein
MLTYDNKKSWSKTIDPIFNSESTVAFVFGGSHLFEPAKLANLIPRAKIIGCSTAGQIAGNTVGDDFLSVGLLNFEKSSAGLFACEILKNDSFATGVKIGHSVELAGLKAVFILSSGTEVNGSKLVAGLNSVLPASIVITGGLAGNGTQFADTLTYHNDRILKDHLVYLAFYGDSLRVHHGTFGGWDFFGPDRMITSSKDNILYELDGEPALDLYKKYLGDRAKDLPGSGLLFPLQISARKNPQNTVVRTILGVDEIQKSLIFAGDMPIGYNARMMCAHFERVIDGAGTASEQMAIPADCNNLMSIAISCVGRRLILGERVIEEVYAVKDRLPKASNLVGFYSYGEISPTQCGEACALHNQSMTITGFTEL